MKTAIIGIATLGLLLSPAGFAQSSTTAKKKSSTTTQAKPAPKEASNAAPKETAKAAPKEAAKPAKETAPNMDPRVTQVYTPKAPPLPEGAVQVDKYTWRVTDKEGKAWIYRRTPFGYSKYEADEQPVEEPVAGLIATDKGDTVDFQRKTPFGVSKWTKKKSELDENELQALKRAAQSAVKGAQE